MPATLTSPQPIPSASTALTEVLVQTITSNAQILRLLDPQRYHELLEPLPKPRTALAEENLEDAWNDLERWLEVLREQDKATLEP